MASLRLFASARSVGKIIGCAGRKYPVEEAKPEIRITPMQLTRTGYGLGVTGRF